MTITSHASRLLDRLFSPRDWSVIHDGEAYDPIYAIPSCRVTSSDTLIYSGERRRTAIRLARKLQRALENHHDR